MEDIKNDNVENVIEEEKGAEERGERSSSFSIRRKTFVVMLVIGILVLILAFVYGIIKGRVGSVGYETIISVEKTDNLSVGYYKTDNGLIRYSKDGALFTKNLQDIIWNQPFEMQSARVVSSEDYLAIGDIGSNTIKVFNEDGLVGTVSTLSPIVDLDISSSGVVYAVLQDGNSFLINAYDTKSTVLMSIRASIDQTGYPIKIANSNDGTKLAVSYVKTAEGKVTSELVFYNFGSAGQGEVDNVVGRYSYDQLFGSVKFIDNDTVVCYGENKVIIFAMRSRPEIVEEINVESEIRSIFSNDRYIGLVVANPDFEKSRVDPYRMLVYTTSGHLHSQKDFDYEYEVINGANESIVSYNGKSCYIFDYDGSTRFRYDFDEPIDSILPTNDINEYIIVFTDRVEDIRLR